jgi:hypothetical protein
VFPPVQLLAFSSAYTLISSHTATIERRSVALHRASVIPTKIARKCARHACRRRPRVANATKLATIPQRIDHVRTLKNRISEYVHQDLTALIGSPAAFEAGYQQFSGTGVLNAWETQTLFMAFAGTTSGSRIDAFNNVHSLCRQVGLPTVTSGTTRKAGAALS